VKAIVYAVLATLIGFAFLAWTGYTVLTYVTGEQATAIVESCGDESAGRRRTATSCEGTWIHDGQTVHGQISGAPPTDLGRRIDVRVKDGVAYRWRWTRLLVPGAIGVFMLVGGALWASGARRGTGS
jgi:hypothetical protein